MLLTTTEAFAQYDYPDKMEHFWDHFYMPIEMGIAFATNANEDPSYYVATCLEYRGGESRTQGWFVSGEYDEHTHGYKDLKIKNSSSIVEGDIQYTDWQIGPGWRQRLGKNFCATALMQVGFTVSTIKSMNYIDTGAKYHLSDDCMVTPTGKLRLGVEYYMNPCMCFFVQASVSQHFKETQVEHNGPRGSSVLSAGINFSLF